MWYYARKWSIKRIWKIGPNVGLANTELWGIDVLWHIKAAQQYLGKSIKGTAGSRETQWQRKPSMLKRVWVELKLEFLLTVKTTKPSSIRFWRKHNLGWVHMQHDLLPPRSIRVTTGKTIGKLTCFWSSCTTLQLGSFTKNWCLGAYVILDCLPVY